MAEHNETGKKGEQLAVDYLVQKKYQILERNWRCGKAEIDILAFHEKTLVAIEVKTRTSLSHGAPESFVSKAKINLLLKAVNAYCEQKNIDSEIRFDIVSVLIQSKNTTLEHIENAFYYF